MSRPAAPVSAADCIWPAGAQLGEGALWSVREAAVLWVDILGRRIHRFRLGDRDRRSWTLPEPVGALIPRKDGPGLMAGLKSGFAEIELEPRLSVRRLGVPEPDSPSHRLNDAKADIHGRIWAGMMNEDEAEDAADGSLFRLDADGRCTRADTGYGVPNGPAFSPDGGTLYHADSPRRVIYRFRVGEGGNLADKAPFVIFEPDWGYPDGMTTDAEGGLWVCHWDGGRVSRFDTNGRLERWISLPVSRVTSCCFGGEALNRLFITSASIGAPQEPLAGGLFEAAPGVTGLAPHAYGAGA